MKLLLNYDKVIIAKSDKFEFVEGGIAANNTIYVEKGLEVVDCDDGLEVVVSRTRFVDGVVLPYVTEQTSLEQQVKALQAKVDALDVQTKAIAIEIATVKPVEEKL